jgi:hypothetical protein
MELVRTMTHVLDFSSLGQNAWQNKFREERFILIHGFRGFSLPSLGSVTSGPMHDEAEHYGSPHRGQEAESKRERGREAGYIF